MSNYQKLASTSIAIALLSLCLVFCIFAVVNLFKGAKQDATEHHKLGEFSSGLKASKLARFYTILLLARRILFVVLLIVFNELDKMVLISIMAFIQAIYFSSIVFIRPFEDKQNNVIEILNEFVFSVLLGMLFHLNTEEAWTGFYSKLYVWIMMGNSVILVLILTGNVIGLIIIA